MGHGAEFIAPPIQVPPLIIDAAARALLSIEPHDPLARISDHHYSARSQCTADSQMATLRRYITPNWIALSGLGELWVLQVSYVVLAVVPVLAGATTWWNSSLAHRAASLHAQRSTLGARLMDAATQRPGEPEYAELMAWINEAGVATSVPELQALMQRAAILGQRVPDVRDLLDEWIGLSQRAAALPWLPPLHLSWKLRMTYLAMVLISIANMLYSVFCPTPLKVIHRPDRQGHAWGLGDRLDWHINLYEFLCGQPTERAIRERTKMVSNLIEAENDDIEIQNPRNPREWTIAAWNSMQRSYPIWRTACALLYGVGLIIVLGALGIYTFEVLCAD